MHHFSAYHVVTERPMALGQTLLLDSQHPNRVYQRVMEKRYAVADIYAHPEWYSADTLEHHTMVALRELALEEVRKKLFPQYPSRLGCLYVSETLADAERWAEWFTAWGRPTYNIVRLEIAGSRFVGDANNCFDATLSLEENLALAGRYWKNLPNLRGDPPIREVLASGAIEVAEIVETINRNL